MDHIVRILNILSKVLKVVLKKFVGMGSTLQAVQMDTQYEHEEAQDDPDLPFELF